MRLKPNLSADVVIVDDDEDDRFLLDLAIDQLSLKVKVITISDARDALTYLQECRRPPSLLITDLNMPCLNGFELLNLLKQSTHYRDIPVVVLTTSQAQLDRERCYRAGANAFIVKPGDFSGMTDLLHSCIQIWLGPSRSV